MTKWNTNSSLIFPSITPSKFEQENAYLNKLRNYKFIQTSILFFFSFFAILLIATAISSLYLSIFWVYT